MLTVDLFCYDAIRIVICGQLVFHLRVIDIVRTQIGGRGGLPNACKCVQGGRGVLALSMHAFWPLKYLQFLVVLMEGDLKPVTSPL